MNFLDVVDVLREQHDEIRRLCSQVERSQGAERQRLFAELCRTVHRHESGEQAVVHPAIRGVAARDEVVTARLREEGVIARSLEELDALGTADPGFDGRFAALHRTLVEHMAREESDEFPLLRLYVRPQRLRWMVGELHDIQVLGNA
ncbi:hemerythrin domain-containing protein [Actinoplanes sp. TBRC 11911]|uniref:hemerythrin domain-containing protein n=1 Tax=Actinoplanes sp. TBRC 11911 TaxID=2729386 RepID=UPI00145DF211|nr:hemerythrin domain-containing protein [Actinoplanes sp. TBRC 11911]NMO54574.1 hemerythrin domain-containing protein [Actinoplanes sp. TBRC 11911]